MARLSVKSVIIVDKVPLKVFTTKHGRTHFKDDTSTEVLV